MTKTPVLIAVLPLSFGGEVIWLCHSLAEALTAITAFMLLRLSKRNVPAVRKGLEAVPRKPSE